jgi:GDP-mannose 6-dehydrogenase
MEIGLIGLGVVGKACRAGFERCGYTVTVHDVALDTHIDELLHTEITYICVPTPSNSTGDCDTSIVESVISELRNKNYEGVIAVKSTVEPGTTQRLIEQYDDRIVFVPEFLKERSAEYDFVFDHRLLLVGTENVNHYYLVVRSHGDLPKSIMRVNSTEAELMKYYHNTFNALRIVFANVYFEMCENLGIDYDKVKQAFLTNGNMPDEYLDVKPELRGYAGACLPKDVRAMANFCEKIGLPSKLFDTIDNENQNFKKTVFKGMRL